MAEKTEGVKLDILDIKTPPSTNASFSIKKNDVTAQVLHIYLKSTIDSAEEYIDLCHELRSLSENDTVYMYIGNYGGSCHGLVSLISAVRDCPAEVNMVVTAPCYSAGSSLALAGDSLEMKDFSFLMFHNYSSFSWGKGGELLEGVVNTKKWIHDYFNKIHSPFLTESECKRVENDKDVYVHYNDKNLSKRLKRHFKSK